MAEADIRADAMRIREAEFRMMEVIVLKLRGTISGGSLADPNVCEHVANEQGGGGGGEKKVERWNGEARVIDFEIRLESTSEDKSECRNVNICRAVLSRGLSHFQNLNGRDARAARYIDFVYRQSCFCRASVTRGASNFRQISNRASAPRRPARNPQQERATRGARRRAIGDFNVR